ncbi:hypothetical protein GCM10010321_88560 [Streptomyces chartreusis]|nr:hypothetical protein GCM10010321_88560 [Streptomyces chartreusis]
MYEAPRYLLCAGVYLQDYGRRVRDEELAAEREALQRLLTEARDAEAGAPPECEDLQDGQARAEETVQRYGDVDGSPFEDALVVPLPDFHDFCIEHRPRLVALVRKVVLERWRELVIDPEDVVQDTLELAVRKWPRIGRMTSPDGYLRRVAAQYAVRAMKKSAREVSTSAEGFLTLFDGVQDRSPEDMVAGDLVREVLSSLPHRQAQVLLLTADGWSDSQIGKKLDISSATVRSHRRYVKAVFLQRTHNRRQGLSDIEDWD